MNEDPTRIMSGGGPERRRSSGGRPPQRPRGNQRLVIAVMGAVIFGLLIGLVVSCSGGGTETVTITTEPEFIEPKQPITPGNEEQESSAEKAENEAEEGEESSGGIESGEEFPEEGEIEEFVPEEEGAGGIEEVAPEEEEGGGVTAE